MPKLKPCATERRDLTTALRNLDEMEMWLPKVLNRIAPWRPLAPGDRVLDVGAAQGVMLVAFARAGFDAYGVEPYAAAREVAREVAETTGVPIEVRDGVGEALPYPDGFFRYVHAISVLEHVDDPQQVFREAYRVLESGGAFYFKTGGVLSPRQAEIAGFPLFPWYPRPLQRRIMLWARDHRPSLVGYTPRPAIHWFKHREVRRWLRAIGFREIVDRWALHSRSGEHTGLTGTLVDLADRHRAVRLPAGLYSGTVEYLAVK